MNRTVNTGTLFLDPRGYPISGANVNFAVTPATGDTGTGRFVRPRATVSDFDGSAVMTLKLTGQGKVQVTPSLTDAMLAQWILLRPEAASQTPIRASPRPASRTSVPFALDPDGTLWFDEGKREDVKLWRPAPPRARVTRARTR